VAVWAASGAPVFPYTTLFRSRGALRHPTVAMLTDLPQGRGEIAFWSGGVLRLLALGCLVLAAAGPRWPDLKTRIQTEGIAIVMVDRRSTRLNSSHSQTSYAVS